MSEIDQFESVFLSAFHESFKYEHKSIQSILFLGDLGADVLANTFEKVTSMLQAIFSTDHPKFSYNQVNPQNTTADILDIIESQKPDLIISYRNLYSNAWQYPHSLGEHLDVLLQKTDVPVLVIPHPYSDYSAQHATQNTDKVMVLSDHLSTENKLTSIAADFTQKNGELTLFHFENQYQFDRMINTISCIQQINTDVAKTEIKKKIISEANHYMNSCEKLLKKTHPGILIHKKCIFGTLISSINDYINQNQIDLLVINTKDQDQLAMHGLSYPLAVELRQIPILMV
ncbi:MAG: hypothetical protein COB02_07270 [Candidatus Cloacimonadota bacterium]|nr:MAG: hypothetical protein COB02_07270 [Candidatus Cloacimonadota bacterium]